MRLVKIPHSYIKSVLNFIYVTAIALLMLHMYIILHENVHMDIFNKFGCTNNTVHIGIIYGEAVCYSGYYDHQSEMYANMLHSINEIASTIIVFIIVGIVIYIVKNT